MEKDILLKFIGEYTLVNKKLIKRCFSDSSLKDIDHTISEALNSQLIIKYKYQGFECFSLTEIGFSQIGIDYAPKHSFSKEKAITICSVNNLRLGIVRELNNYSNLSINRWISGGKFKRFPLITNVRKEKISVTPESLIIFNQDDIQRLYFVHIWNNFDQVSTDLFLYHLYSDRKLFLKRFHVTENSVMRVLCLIPNYKAFVPYINRLKSCNGSELTLFTPITKLSTETPLKSQIWINNTGHPSSII